MATFGIGVSRLVAAVIEQNHDEKGCIWTKNTAPYMVDIIVSNAKKDDELDVALDIYEKLKDAGVQTIIDDRKKERFGFKMSDFELIGFPYAVIVGKKLQDGMVEIVNRKTGEKIELSIEDVVSKIKELIS
jgi:prolyl-tRNA synthetase